MRTYLIPALVGLLAGAGPAPGQSYPAETTVAVPVVDVRSGPTLKFYPTCKLRAGERVFVVRELKDQPGWLAIKPPAGSFSWVSGKYVRLPKDGDPRLGYVEADGAAPVPILAGSSCEECSEQAPNVESAKLTSGSIVVIVGKVQDDGSQKWYPIQPHPSEVRYLPADAVRPPPQQVAGAAKPNWNLSPQGYAGNPLIAQAEQAAQAREYERAKQLFKKAADETTDQNQKMFCLKRLETLTQGVATPGHPTNMAAGKAPPVQSTSFSPSGPAAPAAGASIPVGAAQWSAYGRLRRTAFDVDGQPMYVLEDKRGQTITYVTTQAGTTLREYVGRMVSVFGASIYRADSPLRVQYVVASHVALP